MKHLHPTSEAFTLIEVLIATSLLTIIITTGAGIFLNSRKAMTQLELQNILKSESDFIFDSLETDIQNNTIDYAEYYNYYVINNAGNDFLITGDTFGSNSLAYGKRFINPGYRTGGTSGDNFAGLSTTDDLGATCDTSQASDCATAPSLEVTEDIITGTNPYRGVRPTLPSEASALCDSTTEMFPWSKRPCSFTSNADTHKTDILFLTDENKTKKIIIGKEKLKTSNSSAAVPFYSMARIVLTGFDSNSDGINDEWPCSDEYHCTGSLSSSGVNSVNGTDLTDSDTLTNATNLYCDPSSMSPLCDFVPYSSPSVTVDDLRFYIAPIEDPALAFDEVRHAPYVYVVLKLSLRDPRASQLPQSLRTKTFFRQISTKS